MVLGSRSYRKGPTWRPFGGGGGGGCVFSFCSSPTWKVGSTESCITKPLCSESHSALWPGVGVWQKCHYRSWTWIYFQPQAASVSTKQALAWSSTWEDNLRDFSCMSLSSQDELWETHYASHLIQWEFHPACVGTIPWFASLQKHEYICSTSLLWWSQRRCWAGSPYSSGACIL